MKEEEEDSFRDHIGTITEEGKRRWIFPKKPSGRLYNYRKLTSHILLIFLIGAPFIKVNGVPFMLFNVLERKFVLFGIVFWPQDFHLFFLAMITAVVFIVLFTVVYGRIFCGWICPQTIFMEMVFRRIEYLIDGDRGQQMRLSKSSWTNEKLRKRVLKHTIFFALSFFIANVFLAYLISADELFKLVTDGPGAHLSSFFALIIFSGVFYFVFAWFREQVCIIVCPYGRLQGVMLDRNSVVVAYDYARGENRSKFRKGEDREAVGKGDCIDCGVCVDVCPTGIDIRNGTQLECVNCTACIDGCNDIMDKINKPRGLIRYASEASIADKKPWRMTTRTIAYSIVLSLMVIVLTGFLLNRSEVEATILRVPGQLYQKTEDERIFNLYNFKLINKTQREMELSLKLISHDGQVELVGFKDGLKLEKSSRAEGTLFLYMELSELKSDNTKVRFGIYEGDKLVEKFSTSFNGPIR